MNLAVHGLSGDIRQANTYYEDVHKSVGRFDFVMANAGSATTTSPPSAARIGSAQVMETTSSRPVTGTTLSMAAPAATRCAADLAVIFCLAAAGAIISSANKVKIEFLHQSFILTMAGTTRDVLLMNDYWALLFSEKNQREISEMRQVRSMTVPGNRIRKVESMSSVSSIGASLIASAQNVASGGSSSTSSVAAAAQEATETKAQTLKEAQQGDPVAKRKIAKAQAQAQQQAEEQSGPSEPNKGTLIDKAA